MKKIFLLLLICPMFLMFPVQALEEIVPDLSAEQALEVIVPDFADQEAEAKSFSERITGGVEWLIVKPKIVEFKNNRFVNSVAAGFVFQGTSDIHWTDNDTSPTKLYPLYTEVWTEVKTEGNKGSFIFRALPSQNTDNYDKKFKATLLDVNYRRQLGEKHYMMIGQQRTFVGLDTFVAPRHSLFIKRSQLTAKYGLARAVGMSVGGDYGVVDWNMGGFFSTRLMQDFGEGGEFASWVNVKPFRNQEGSVLKNLRVGGGINYGKRYGEDYTISSFGADWKYKKWLAATEFGVANGSNGVSGFDKNKTKALHTYVGYNITDKWQVLARYDVFDPNRQKSNDLRNQYTAALNYYILKDRLKLGLNYMLMDDQNASQNKKHAVYFMTQVQI